MFLRPTVFSFLVGCSLLCALAFWLRYACGDHPVSSHTATPDDAASSNNEGACNNLVNTAPIVRQTFVNQPAPSPRGGGAIVPGTYYLTDSKIYQGAPPGRGPLELQATQVIAGASMKTVQHVGNSANSIYDTRTYSSSATLLTVTFVCGGKGTQTVGFDATPSQYTTYNSTAKTVNIWTRQ